MCDALFAHLNTHPVAFARFVWGQGWTMFLYVSHVYIQSVLTEWQDGAGGATGKHTHTDKHNAPNSSAIQTNSILVKLWQRSTEKQQTNSRCFPRKAREPFEWYVIFLCTDIDGDIGDNA